MAPKLTQEFIDNMVNEIILSTEEEMKVLFPDAEILREKVFNFTIL